MDETQGGSETGAGPGEMLDAIGTAEPTATPDAETITAILLPAESRSSP